MITPNFLLIKWLQCILSEKQEGVINIYMTEIMQITDIDILFTDINYGY